MKDTLWVWFEALKNSNFKICFSYNKLHLISFEDMNQDEYFDCIFDFLITSDINWKTIETSIVVEGKDCLLSFLQWFRDTDEIDIVFYKKAIHHFNDASTIDFTNDVLWS